MKESKRFGHRLIGSFCAMAVLFLATAVRVADLTADKTLLAAGEKETTYRLPLYSCRGTIYDTAGLALTETASARRCILPPNEKGVAAAEELLTGSDREAALDRLENGYPTTVYLGDRALPLGAVEYYQPVRYGGNLARHLIGYVDASGHGVGGLEEAWDDLLYTDSGTEALFSVTATGKILPERETVVREGTPGGRLRLTVNRSLQSCAEEVMNEVTVGAMVITEAETGKIRALVSRPTFDPNHPDAYLNRENAPFLNRAFCRYNVGSVFKSLVAGVALDEGADETGTVTCNGELLVENHLFHCHEEAGHGTVSMPLALAQSCNVYFYRLIQTISPAAVLEAGIRCGFTGKVTVGGLTGDEGILPSEETLRSAAARCNFVIGQGQTMLTPLHLARLYGAIVNGGIAKELSLIEEINRETVKNEGAYSVLFSSRSADRIKQFLVDAVSVGTGLRAKPKAAVTVGGKTATAQTGVFVGGNRQLVGWYCGFAEIEGVSYVITLVREGVTSGASDCAPLFAETVDKMANFLQNRASHR